MPSPFPGMDPYIESQGRWPDFHSRLIAYLCDGLSDRLPEAYVAQIGEDVQFVTWDPAEPPRRIVPDVAVSREPDRTTGRLADRPEAGVAVLEPDLEPADVSLVPFDQEVRHTWIEILRLPEGRLVTVLELLSPTNKGSSGRGIYLAKRARLIEQEVNLVEIDLLLGGQRLPMGGPLPRGDYLAFVSRFRRRPLSEVYAWSIRRALPKLPIPLLPPDPDVVLELAPAFALAYDRGRYARLLDYRAPLDLPMGGDDRSWAEGLAWAGRA